MMLREKLNFPAGNGSRDSPVKSDYRLIQKIDLQRGKVEFRRVKLCVL